MQKRKMPKDRNQLAAQIVAMSTGQQPPPEKNPAAVATETDMSGVMERLP